MPKEMREYENQEMESNESPVPQEDEEHTVEGTKKNKPQRWKNLLIPLSPHRHPPVGAAPRRLRPDGPLWWPLGRSCRLKPRRKRIRTPCWT